ncbi:uncharacterized protein LOC123290400 [Chrysoperla carnea]|uniref:uncharacterized protein LOC123290400 n=1 Tax=Chrysoperla carnea TaxID=189513 RepID=UPI001D07167D|nr:uncharacterized protein LOC123290400 [Chrysoperla carnea]
MAVVGYKPVAKIKSLEQDESLLEYADFRDLKQRKYNKTTMVFSGKLIILKPYGKAQIMIHLSKKLGNGYIPISLVDSRKRDYCEMLNNPEWQKEFFQGFFSYINIPNNCNHIPGEYQMTNMGLLDMPDNMPYGDYRLDLEYFMNDKPADVYGRDICATSPLQRFFRLIAETQRNHVH